jgi:hypothetical protein
MFGKDMDTASSWKRLMEKAGFVNVQEVVYKVCKTASKNPKDTNHTIAPPKSLAKRPQTQRAREIPPAQHARSDAAIYVCALYSRAQVGTH